MVARLSLLQLFLAFAVATAWNDPPPSSERAWAPPNLPNYERELGGGEAGSRVTINPRKVYNLAELIDIAERNNPRNARRLGTRATSGTRLTAEWQTGVETMSGCRQRKLRLSFAPSPPQCEAGQIDTRPKDDGATSCSRSTFKCQRR
jgi:hypothetical protein